jgi:hypothetical protein
MSGLSPRTRSFLHRPRVAVRVGEAEECPAVAPVEDRDLARLDAALEQLLPCGPSIRDAELETLPA